MANFKTHVGAALGVSAFSVAIAVNGGLIELAQSHWYVSMGVVGGMLPDIDAAKSRPFKHLFMGLAIWAGSLAWHALEKSLSEKSLLLAVFAVAGFVRYPLAYLFQKMTVHRGVFHSLLAGIFFSLSLVCIWHYLLGASRLDAWLSGIFLLLGFVVHLCLDELFSVDLANGRMKKSFGTALKLYGYQNVSGSVLLLSLVAGLLILAPSAAPLYKALSLVDWTNAAELVPRLSHVLSASLG